MDTNAHYRVNMVLKQSPKPKRKLVAEDSFYARTASVEVTDGPAADVLPSPRRAFTDLEVSQLRSLAAEGLSCRDIAERMGRDRDVIYLKAKNKGIEIAKSQTHGSTPEMIDTIRTMAGDGYLLVDIAEAVNRSTSAVRKKLRKLGISYICGKSGEWI